MIEMKLRIEEKYGEIECELSSEFSTFTDEEMNTSEYMTDSIIDALNDIGIEL